ncbi:MAG: tRNA (adenosine(37)-N6)-dimethylallyltransferase MiaA [Candidatus Omnitrophica bacterium]|nr:tRNA (adenosine(37)-N6)-dimethylallyltransferase MiaA [Candidatus Omnitrophota bacterium]
MKQIIIFIVGPTSSGKSRVAASLARKINGEVVSCDSMQVYRDMDIVTRPPEKDLLEMAAHHLVRIISPEEEFSAALFVERAKTAIIDIFADKNTPIITGGTGLYMKALIDGIFEAPPKNEILRKELEDLAEEKGRHALYKRLKEIDPETADRLHPNDIYRIIRAIEVYSLTGETIAEKRKGTEGIFGEYDCRLFGLEIPRDILCSRIENNVDKMFEEGLVKEVERINKLKLSLTAKKALGIKEITAFLRGEISQTKAKEELKKNTRRYAKRQLTWFRGDERVMWIDGDRSVEDIVKEIELRTTN